MKQRNKKSLDRLTSTAKTASAIPPICPTLYYNETPANESDLTVDANQTKDRSLQTHVSSISTVAYDDQTHAQAAGSPENNVHARSDAKYIVVNDTNTFVSDANIVVSDANIVVSDANIFVTTTGLFASDACPHVDPMQSHVDPMQSYVCPTQTYVWTEQVFADPAYTYVSISKTFASLTEAFASTVRWFVSLPKTFVSLKQFFVDPIQTFAALKRVHSVNDRLFPDWMAHLPDENQFILSLQDIVMPERLWSLSEVDVQYLFTVIKVKGRKPQVFAKPLIKTLYSYCPDQRPNTMRLIGKPSEGPSPPLPFNFRQPAHAGLA